ncbi:PMR1-type calcium-transporting P-type ATPase [Radiomyces spectabilis]|uniref:PMR1-type calcium-transporting P-type ATPase n=1 Tax=Radiomyces spectabilis TaxID=64574 RepID=UPI0022208132|nr:PMR1-type calcium-transporting P-type ATPase [Radiomyces spectabilis]KAI8377809.1 PMR1-type calcium-transporting P-type ATPase [Radiomyces spectabilis]
MATSLAGKTTPSAKAARQSIQQVVSDFNSHVQRGLFQSDIPSLRTIYGSNELEKDEEESIYTKFLKSFSENPLILLLLGSALVSLLMGQMDDAISITMAIIIVMTVAFVQEYKSEKSLEALNKLVPHYCHLVREGQMQTTLANELVPGDLVHFSIGDRIPADCRLVTAVDLEIDESNLTGENKPRRKILEAIGTHPYSELSLAERDNIAFMGTLVRNGHGTGIVVATGKSTEFGNVFEMMQEVEVRKTPLQISMNELGKQLSIFSFGVIAVIVLIGLIQRRSWLEMFTIGVSLAVAAIPEGLPIVVTVTLALGVLRMANRRAIVKQLPSVETLGSVNVVCADKTGTLTVNQMTVTKVFTVHNQELFNYEYTAPTTLSDALRQTLLIGNLCNNAYVSEQGTYIGQPTDIALLDVVLRSGLKDERHNYHRLGEEPFNSDQKYMSVTCRHQHEKEDVPALKYFKGATEILLERCTTYYESAQSQPAFPASLKEAVSEHVAAMSSNGLRVLCTAFGTGDHALCFTGFLAVYDPPREGIADATRKLVQGGVKVIMITGDSEATAMSIARKLGIPMNNSKHSCLTGRDIEAMSERQLQEMIHTVSVFARTTPKHKLAIVKAYQNTGAVVAMTGDGVNDAPALKMADIGISMGKSGTDVSKEAADMILVDDDFSTILHAIEEGKAIFYNIQNFLTFQLSTSISALSLIALCTLFGYSTPLNAMQILWINIIMDGPPAQSLGVEPVDPDIMKKPPRARNANILSKRLVTRVLTAAAVVVVGTLFVYISEMKDGIATQKTATMTFTTFVFFDMFNALSCRSEKQSIATIGFFSNRMFNFAVGGSIISQLLVIYVPFLQRIFQTQPLSFYDLLKIVLVSSTVFWIDEVKKYCANKGLSLGRDHRSKLKYRLSQQDRVEDAINAV